MPDGYIEFSAFNIGNWSWGGEVLYLDLYAGDTWTDIADIIHLVGDYENDDGRLQRCPGIVNLDGTAQISTFITAPTLNAIDNQRVGITGVLRDENFVARRVLFRKYSFPTAPTPMTWRTFRLSNITKRLRLSDLYGTWPMTLALFAQVFEGVIQAASTVILGGVRMSRDPDIPGSPIAVSDNDERLVAASGIANVVAGVKVVALASVTEDSRIVASSMSLTVIGSVIVAQEEITPGVSFVIRTTNEGDNGPVCWLLYEP